MFSLLLEGIIVLAFRHEIEIMLYKVRNCRFTDGIEFTVLMKLIYQDYFMMETEKVENTE